MSASRTPGQRAGLTRERIVTCARQALTETGPDLTMRGLARRLGVAPNALYSHVRSKTDLVDEVLDEVLADVAEPPAELDDPLVALHQIMSSTLEVLLAHPGLVPLYVARRGARGENAHRLGGVMRSLLERMGITGTTARQAQQALIVYTIGFASLGTATPFGSEPGPPAEGLDESFEAGLRWLLSGIAGSSDSAG